MPVPLRPNQCWSLDFLSDTFGACRKFRILAVSDDCCCENLALIADTSISGASIWHYIDLEKPQQNGYIESFTGPQLRGFGFQ